VKEMAKAVWTGSLSFGLVSIPVKLYTATEPKDVRFHQFDRETGRRVRYRRVTETAERWVEEGDWQAAPDRLSQQVAETEPEQELETSAPPQPIPQAPAGETPPAEVPPAEVPPAEVAYQDIVKGFEIDRDRYVMVSPDELRTLEPERSRSIDIEAFVDLADIDPIYFEKSYYVAPARGAEKPYGLLLAALRRARRVGVARFVLRSREYLAALRPLEEILALETLFFADEVRAVEEIDNVPVRVPVAERELGIAEQLIDLLGTKWVPSQYHDTYRERVLGLIESRAAMRGVVREEPPAEPPRVADLMAALKASVDAARNARPGPRKGRRTG
jgi:DNA end-binding protein Ku